MLLLSGLYNGKQHLLFLNERTTVNKDLMNYAPRNASFIGWFERMRRLSSQKGGLYLRTLGCIISLSFDFKRKETT